MRRIALGALVILTAAALLIPSAEGSGKKTARELAESRSRTSRLPGSQPLSPPLLVVHSRARGRVEPAARSQRTQSPRSPRTQTTRGRVGPDRLPRSLSVETGAGGPIPPGATHSFTVQTRGEFDRLTVLTMLVNTNDAFTGLDSLHVHGHGLTRSANAYDAGSERNNEQTAYIPGPCCGHPFVPRSGGRCDPDA